MKTYEMRTKEVLEKVKIEKKRRKRRIYSASAAVACVSLVLCGAMVMSNLGYLSLGALKPTTPPTVLITAEKPVSLLENTNSYDEYSDIYSHLVQPKRKNLRDYIGEFFFGGAEKADKAAEIDAVVNEQYANLNETAEAPTPADMKESEDFSGTNTQVEGIDEADIVKTDGKYIYAKSGSNLYIVSADNGKMETVSKIPLKLESVYINCEMYVNGDTLVTVSHYYGEKNCTDVTIYDISDRTAPKLKENISQSGYMVSSRMQGSTLYLITNDYYYDSIKKSDPSTYIPKITNDDDTMLFSAEEIYCSAEDLNDDECVRENSYLNICAIDTDSVEIKSKLSLLGLNGPQVYQSENAIYIAKNNWNHKTTDTNALSQTKILKITTGDVLTLSAEGSVDGELLNQFSMDEYKGYFRLVTTVDSGIAKKTEGGLSYWEEVEKTNALYVLDGDLKTVGSITGLAKDEQIYSARFYGDIAYFVTFVQTDPLFCADLSDPEAPKILSELKIPGYSTYLHKFTDDLLLGIGFDTYINEWGGVQTGNLKLSMFDISDKTNVTEAAKKVLAGAYYSEAAYNHHAILINSSKNIIAFPTNGSSYRVFSYENGEFVEKTTFNMETYESGQRGLYIGDYLYVCAASKICSYSLDTFEGVQTLPLDEDVVVNDYYK